MYAVLVYTLAAWCGSGFGQQESQTRPPALPRALRSLPQDLASLQQATGFHDWPRVQGYSRALTHHRQLRFAKDSNVFISETGIEAGQIGVIEVILMPLDSSEKAEFALYDPTSGKRSTHYPDSIKFDVFGSHGGSRNAAPGLCIACHEERKPLILLIPWNQILEDDLKRSRATGQGIRQDLMIPVPNDAATRDRITGFNKIMRDSFPGRINDIREWMVIRTRPQAER